MKLEIFIYLFLAVFSWGISTIFDKLTLKHLTPITSFYARTFAMTFIFVILFLTRFQETMNEINQSNKISLVYIFTSVIITMFGVFAYLKALNLGDASKIVPLSSTYPLITFFAAILFLGESFTWTKFLGTLFIITGVYLISK